MLAADTAADALGYAPWLQPLRDWPGIVLQGLQRESVIVRILIAAVQGSAPRESGVCMLVGADSIRGTVGGGQLEWQALATARAMLTDDAVAVQIHRIVLGGDLGQCCGGVVDLWIERYTNADTELLRQAQQAMQRGPALLVSTLGAKTCERRAVCDGGSDASTEAMLRAPRERVRPRITRNAGGAELIERLDDAMMALWLYGAGHVGQALARIVMQLPLRLTWIDSRAYLFPAQVPDTVQLVPTTQPVTTVATAPAGVRYAIMTHSHSLDYSLCRAILTRDDVAWVGLIGSHSKAARFRSRLARHGVSAERISRLVCPIGVRGIDSKWPAAIAVGVAAQLLQDISAQPTEVRSSAAPEHNSHACGAGDCEACHASGAETK